MSQRVVRVRRGKYAEADHGVHRDLFRDLVLLQPDRLDYLPIMPITEILRGQTMFGR